MPVDGKIVEQIDALTQAEFRASVNATRRATLAIGALILHWGQLDSSMGSLIEWLRARHVDLGFDGFPDTHPSDHAGQLSLIRKLIGACCTDTNRLRDFDRLRQRISKATAIRDDLVHGALGLGNETGTDEGLYIFCAPYRKPRKSDGRVLPAYLELRSHLISEIFQTADDLWNDLHSLERLVQVVLADDPT